MFLYCVYFDVFNFNNFNMVFDISNGSSNFGSFEVWGLNVVSIKDNFEEIWDFWKFIFVFLCWDFFFEYFVNFFERFV